MRLAVSSSATNLAVVAESLLAAAQRWSRNPLSLFKHVEQIGFEMIQAAIVCALSRKTLDSKMHIRNGGLLLSRALARVPVLAACSEPSPSLR